MIQTNPKNTRLKFFFPLFFLIFFSSFSFCDVNDDLVKAIKNNDYKNFEIALKNGADPNAKDAYSSVLLLTLSNSQEQMAIDLISKGANINDGYSVSTNAIFLAVNNKLSKASNLLINLGADITQLRQDGINILMMAVNRDMQEVALNIISKKKLDINAVDKAGDTALSLALNKNYLEMAKILYKHGAKPRNMFEAIPIKDIESVKNFIEDTRQLMSIDKEGNTPLHTAYIYSNYEIAHLILKKKSINIDSENKNHLTASMIAAMNNDLKLISLAMGYGADILIPDRNGLTPLMYAVFYRNYELIWKILDYNKHAAFSIDNDGSSAFSYAVAYRDKKICQKLLKINGVMNQRKAKSPLSIAIANLDENMVELLLKNDVAINVKDCFDLTPLSMAIKMNSPKMVKFLLAKGADPQLTDRDGKTPLYYAQIYGNQDILDLLDTNTERHVDYYKK
ncbi:MAG: ankyrin repeat domain-containing protein [Endomicrobium sp.]|jgi:ankyrin repeat protein|nr:ankyrin repeat domain-containing protein [Endomicrobium sp.]